MGKRSASAVVATIVRPEDEPIGASLSQNEVLKIYLTIQQHMGMLENAVPNEQLRRTLSMMSVRLLQIKREWIGHIGEIDAEIDFKP